MHASSLWRDGNHPYRKPMKSLEFISFPFSQFEKSFSKREGFHLKRHGVANM
jgi:hypothetical protein